MYYTRKCFGVLLCHLGTNFGDDKWGTGFNILHRVVLPLLAKEQLLGTQENRKRYNDFWKEEKSGAVPNATVEMLQFALDSLSYRQWSAVPHADHRGRLPLHYAAEAGLLEICEALLNGINKWENMLSQENEEITLRQRFFADSEGNTPLHLSVLNDHAEVTRYFLDRPNLWCHCIDADTGPGDFLAQLLQIALKKGSKKTTQILLEDRQGYQINLDYTSLYGETALFVAARCGSVNMINMLAQSSGSPIMNINKAEDSYGWTPLIVACVMEHLDVVAKLLDLGADEGCRDLFGWTALDHVTFRGYWEIAKLLKPDTRSGTARWPKTPLSATNALPPCLPEMTRIFVNIGCLNTRQYHDAVDLSPYLSERPYSPYPAVDFQIEVSGIDCIGPTKVLSVPFLDDQTNYPLVFETSTPRSAKVALKLYSAESNSEKYPQSCIGMAVALLHQLGNTLGPGRESFFRDHKLPIIDSTGGEILGTVTLNFLLVKPNPDPRPQHIKIDQRAWYRNGETRLIGHRGIFILHL